MITLNQQQREAVDRMHEFCKGAEKMFLLEGYAGTGKTTCVQTLIKESAHINFALTAPTNKATKVLRSISESEEAVGVPCRTIYSLLGLRLTKDSEFVEINPLGECDADHFDVIIVDEASMVNANLFRYIVSASVDTQAKFIFMGDPLQLPPVGEQASPALLLKNKVCLTKVERHDNQILTFATNLRESILKGEKPKFLSDNDDKGGVYCVDSRVMRKNLEKAYTAETYQLFPGSIKTIAWRNVTVNGYNEIIRESIYGSRSAEMFVMDERVVTTHPIADLQEPDKFLMVTDEEANVVKVEVIPHPRFPEIIVYSMLLETEFDGNWAQAFVVHPDSLREYTQRLSELADRARSKKISWRSFWDFKNGLFHDVRPCHAITAHRSQGSTYESAFVDVGDIMANYNGEEALRCLYVAATRASRVLVLRTR